MSEIRGRLSAEDPSVSQEPASEFSPGSSSLVTQVGPGHLRMIIKVKGGNVQVWNGILTQSTMTWSMEGGCTISYRYKKASSSEDMVMLNHAAGVTVACDGTQRGEGVEVYERHREEAYNRVAPH